MLIRAHNRRGNFYNMVLLYKTSPPYENVRKALGSFSLILIRNDELFLLILQPLQKYIYVSAGGGKNFQTAKASKFLGIKSK